MLITIISGKFCTCIPASGNDGTSCDMHVNFVILMVQHINLYSNVAAMKSVI